MKNLRLVICLSVIALLLLLPFQSLAQEASQGILGGFFGKVGSWVNDTLSESLIKGIAWFVGGWLSKHGWTFILKKIAQRSAVVFKELGEFSHEMEALSTKIDGAIRDDGSIVANSIGEVMAQGNRVILEGKDVIISIKPKP